MKLDLATSIIHNSLIAYVEDSAGAESEETKVLEKAWDLVKSNLDIQQPLELRFVCLGDNGLASYTESYPTHDKGHSKYDTIGLYRTNEEGFQDFIMEVDPVHMQEFKTPTAHDVGMISAIISGHILEDINENTPNGIMEAYDFIARVALEFHFTYEGLVNWGEDDLSLHGFKNSGCWDEAVLEFATNKLTEVTKVY